MLKFFFFFSSPCQGGGSIRIPAALCGAFGLKATFGRISEAGAFPLTVSLGHLGPIAATAADAALVYRVLSQPDDHVSKKIFIYFFFCFYQFFFIF